MAKRAETTRGSKARRAPKRTGQGAAGQTASRARSAAEAKPRKSGTPSHRREQRSDRRARILAAAGELFAEYGPDAVSVADVAEAAGVSRATVFNHFGSKRALLEGITEAVLADYEVLLENALADRETPVPVLVRALFSFMGAGIEATRRFHRAVFREIARLSLGLDEGGPGQVARQAALDRLEELLERGQQQGELRAEHRPADLAMAFDSLVFGTITHWLYDDASESLQLRMERAADVFLGPVASEKPAPWDGPEPVLTEPVPLSGARGGIPIAKDVPARRRVSRTRRSRRRAPDGERDE